MRDQAWLEEKLESLWEDYFSDVPRENKVIVKFGKRANRTLGSIRYQGQLDKKDPEYNLHDDKRITQITVTRHFTDTEIPDVVVLGTIAHEMVHYTHGFHSPLKQQYRHPHKGGIIKKEMYSRGLNDVFDQSEKWIKDKWMNYLKSKGAWKSKTRPRRRRNVLYILRNI